MSENSSTEPQLAVIILAAGQGTRMKSTLPKVLHRIGGRPLRRARARHGTHARSAEHPRRRPPRARSGGRRRRRTSRPRSWSSTRTRSPAPAAPSKSPSRRCPTSPAMCSCSAGTCPCSMTRRSPGSSARHRDSGAAATAAERGRGRCHRLRTRSSAMPTGGVQRIVEQKDATADEASITEINAGVYVFQAAPLRAHICARRHGECAGRALPDGRRRAAARLPARRGSVAGAGCRRRTRSERPGAAV